MKGPMSRPLPADMDGLETAVVKEGKPELSKKVYPGVVIPQWKPC